MHCYTFNPKYKWSDQNSIDEILNDLNNKTFDVLYISGHKENFVDVNVGLELCEKLYDKFKCDLLITTRNIFNKKQITRLSNLNKKMKSDEKDMFFCISIPALSSHKKLESNLLIPSPNDRIEFLKQVHTANIYTMLTIKPLCPNNFIPTKEISEIIRKCYKYSSIILSSGIVVDEFILKRLNVSEKCFAGTKDKLMECLENDIDVTYVDVDSELKEIKKMCDKYSVPFFEHSMPAIELN